jgi:CheY-like chemotaxis protein
LKETKEYILSIGKDLLTQRILKVILKNRGYRALGTRNGTQALEVIRKKTPALILIDAGPREMNFDKFSKALRADPQGAPVPLLSLQGMETDSGGNGKFANGTVNWLINPVNREFLLRMVETYLGKRPGRNREYERPLDLKLRSSLFAFQRFKVFLKMKFNLPDSFDSRLDELPAVEVYSFGDEIGVVGSRMAGLIAEFLNIPYQGYFPQDEILRDIISEEFCKKKWVLPLKGRQSPVSFVLSNPFDTELLDDLQKIVGQRTALEIGVMDSGYLNIFLNNNDDTDLEVVFPEGENTLTMADWIRAKRKYANP